MVQPIGYQNKILIEAGTNELEIITFYLHWHHPTTRAVTTTVYGINAAKVKELIAVPEEIIGLPERHSECVKGVFLLRDRTITLTDLCQWFGYQADISPEASGKWVAIVVEINAKTFGFITHGVDKVHRISWKQVQPPPSVLGKNQSITGICMANDQIIQMVDFEKIVAVIDPSMRMTSFIAGDLVGPAERQKAVVIVDDSRTILLHVRRTLETAGLKVVPHSDGQAAWEYLESVRERGRVNEEILAVITDIEMPRMDGHHLCLRIKKEPAYRRVPVLLFSSMISDGLRHKGLAVGADDQVIKPELANLVERMQACRARIAKQYAQAGQ
jgi:two-component system, chemotaxis family, chemotaxis protein CheV